MSFIMFTNNMALFLLVVNYDFYGKTLSCSITVSSNASDLSIDDISIDSSLSVTGT